MGLVDRLRSWLAGDAVAKATAEAAAGPLERARIADDYQGRRDDIAVEGGAGPVSPLLPEGDAYDAFGSTERPPGDPAP